MLVSSAMRCKRALRGAVKWACTVIPVLLLVLGPLSGFYSMFCWGTIGRSEARVGVDIGSAYILVVRDGPQTSHQQRWGCAAVHEPASPFFLFAWQWPWNRLTPITGTAWQLAVPFWAALTPFAAAGAMMWRHDWRRKARPAWACQACGYDRRGLATPDAACPECGHGSGA